MASLTLSTHATDICTSGPLHLLFPLSGNFSPPGYLQGSHPHFLQVFIECHTIREAFPDPIYEKAAVPGPP